jgi:hypothetical protein
VGARCCRVNCEDYLKIQCARYGGIGEIQNGATEKGKRADMKALRRVVAAGSWKVRQFFIDPPRLISASHLLAQGQFQESFWIPGSTTNADLSRHSSSRVFLFAYINSGDVEKAEAAEGKEAFLWSVNRSLVFLANLGVRILG